MDKLDKTLNTVLASLRSADDDEIFGGSGARDANAQKKIQGQDNHRRFLRITQVRKKWEQALAEVFRNPEVERLILAHTNEVGIVNEKNFRGQTYKKLYVYVDDSIVSSELNAQRELLKLCFQMKLDEDIELIEILTARGARRKKHPYAAKTSKACCDPTPSIPLSEEELQKVEQTLTTVEKTAQNRELVRSLKRAMIADLERKKGISKKSNKK